MDEAWRESVRRTPEQERNMTATFTVGEKEIMQEDMKQLTKSYYDAIKRIKELTETIEELKNEVCLLYTSPSPRDAHESRMPSSA